MNLEQLRSEWADRNLELERQVRFNRDVLRRQLVQRHRRVSVGFAWGELYLQWAIALVAAVAGGLLVKAMPGLELAACSIAIALWMTAVLADRTMQFVALRRLDYSLPILARQQCFETLRLRRLIHLRWSLATGAIVWCVPLLAVTFWLLAGVDLFAAAPSVAYGGLLSSVAFVVASGLAFRLVARHGGGVARFGRIVDHLAGQDIVAARRLIVELEAFDRGESPPQEALD